MSSAVEMDLGPVLDIAPLNLEVMMAIVDPSILHPSAGISPCVSDIMQQYIKGKQAAAVPAPILASTPGPSTSGVRHARMITTPVKPAGWGKATSHSKAKVSKSSVAVPAILTLPVPLAPAPAPSGAQHPPAVSAAVCTAQYFQQSKLCIQ